MFRKTLTIAALVGVVTGTSAAQAAETVRFGIISTESQQNLATVWEPFLTQLAKRMGTKVKGYYASDYAGVIEAMRFNKVDVAWFGNKSAIVAVDRSGGEVFAQTVDA